MKNITTRHRTSSDVKALCRYLARRRRTEKNPLVLKGPVRISQTVDDTGFLDFVHFDVVAIWHDRNKVFIRHDDDTGQQTLQLTDTYQTNYDGHYLDSIWDVKALNQYINTSKEI